MPLVFIHGVNNRSGAAYDAGLKVKDSYFRKCFEGTTVNGKPFQNIGPVVFPYWGDLGVKLAWNMASLPSGDMQNLGPGIEFDLRLIIAHIRDAVPGEISREPLLSLARKDGDIRNVAQILAAACIEQAPAGQADDIATFAMALQEYASADPSPGWLANTTTDQQLVGYLFQSVQASPSLQAQGLGIVFNFLGGLVNKLKAAAASMAGQAVDAAGDFASTKLLSWNRTSLNAELGRFFGDVFIYFDTRGDRATPGPINQKILAEIDAAVAAAPPGEPLVVVGHSLGGVIMFDLLGHYRPNLVVDLFVSVGSQVAHFEEMKFYRTSDPTIVPPHKAPKPSNLRKWINVYDEVDIFAYQAKSVFSGVDIDVRYDTHTYVIKAHGAYFDQMNFYDRLRAQVGEL